MSSETTDQKAEWFYLEGEETRGPYTSEEIKTFLMAGMISGTTLICREGMLDWACVSSLPDFKIESQNAVAPRTKTNQSGKILIAAGTLLMIGIVLGFAWYFGIHKPKIRELAREEEQQRRLDLHQAKAKADAKKREEQTEAKKAEEQERAEKEAQMARKLAEKLDEMHQEEITRRLATERTSLDRWISYIQRASSTRNIQDDMVAAREVAPVLAQAISEFPDPPIGVRANVDELLNYIKDKFNGIDRVNAPMIGYNVLNHVWVIHDKTGGCMFSPADLDPSSAQIVSRPEQYYSDVLGRYNSTGRTRYFIRFTTTNSQKRVIICGPNPNAFGINGVELADNVEVFCGFGPGDQETERIGTALAGIIMAYGGKNELINNSSLSTGEPTRP